MTTSIGTPVHLSLVDPVGTVFSNGEKIFRLISDDWVEHSLSLLKSGLIDELVNEGLFPKTSISEICIQDHSLILEHEVIPVVSYPYEWSPSMLQDAALLLIKVNKIAKKYGYFIKDAHTGNILFKGSRPVFIDFGSFLKKESGSESNINEFFSYCIVPLTLFQEGDYDLSYKVILASFSVCSELLLGHQSNYLQKKSNKYDIYKIYFFDLFILNLRNKIVTAFFIKLTKKIKFIKMEKSLDFLEEQVSRFRFQRNLSNISSKSQNYYKFSEIPYRFEKILEITNTLNSVSSSLDIGGNNAYFSFLLSKLSKFEKLISMDYDIFAVETAYLLAKENSININLIVNNFLQLTDDIPLVKRLQSDVVYGLELTQELILSRNLPINIIFNVFNNVSNKYVFIEFMPFGLWSDDHNSTPNIPSWYTIEWFRDNFLCFFNLIEEIKIEKNRILFFGEKKI
jgi:hypothetical protein